MYKRLYIISVLIFVILLSIINTRPTLEHYENKFDPYDDLYCKITNIITNDHALIKYDADRISKIINKETSNKAHILIIECGTGLHYKYFAENNCDVIGADKSHNMIRYAKINNPTGDFIQSNYSNAKAFKENEFDAIVCFNASIYGTESPKVDFKNICSWLKPGGYLFIPIYNKDKIDPAPQPYSQYYKSADGIKHSITYFDDFTHEAWFNSEGNSITYNEKIIMEDGRAKEYRKPVPPLSMDKTKIMELCNGCGFKIKDILDYKQHDIRDYEIYCFSKIN